MRDADRFKLLSGPYDTPRCLLGDKLFCEIHGWVPVRRFSEDRIPWPQTLAGRNESLILCGDLLLAVRRESNEAICHWWGVTPETVACWRKALNIAAATDGMSRLFRPNAMHHLGRGIKKA